MRLKLAPACIWITIVNASISRLGRYVVRRANRHISLVKPINHETPIHLSISAFFDGDRCAKTIERAFEHAAAPMRLSIGVVQARNESAIDCKREFVDQLLPGLCLRKFPGNSLCLQQVAEKVVLKRIDPYQAEGPAHQRSMARELINFDREDKMCMQTDSHMDFLDEWDDLLTEDFNATNNEFAVLSAYVMDVGARPYSMDQMVDCCGYEDEDGIPRGRQCGNAPRYADSKPILTTLWAAGFSFHRCHAEMNVPIDPNLEWIFTGEEIDRAIRLWTNGYDLYLPTRGAVLHNYSHANQGFWSAGDPGDIMRKAQASKKKLASLLEDRTGNRQSVGEYYGLGKQRTLDEWNEWAKPFLRQSCHSRGLKRHSVIDPGALRESIHKHPDGF